MAETDAQAWAGIDEHLRAYRAREAAADLPTGWKDPWADTVRGVTAIPHSVGERVMDNSGLQGTVVSLRPDGAYDVKWDNGHTLPWVDIPHPSSFSKLWARHPGVVVGIGAAVVGMGLLALILRRKT